MTSTPPGPRFDESGRLRLRNPATPPATDRLFTVAEAAGRAAGHFAAAALAVPAVADTLGRVASTLRPALAEALRRAADRVQPAYTAPKPVLPGDVLMVTVPAGMTPPEGYNPLPRHPGVYTRRVPGPVTDFAERNDAP